MNYHVAFDIDFKRNPYKGLYVVIEGIDGSGKTTQVERLAKYFESQGKTVVVTAEPRKNKGIFGELIQAVLLSQTKIPSVAFQYLFSADRAVHHEELIVPSLTEGKVVISDRCFWSAVPYGILDQMTQKDNEYSYDIGKVILVAQSILSMYHQFMVPDTTFYLDISVPQAVKRLAGKQEEKEIYEKKETLEKIVLGYKWLLSQFPEEFTTINGNQDVEKVTDDIIKFL